DPARAAHGLEADHGLHDRPSRHGGVVSIAHGVVASHQGRRVPLVLRAHVRTTEGAERGTRVSRSWKTFVGALLALVLAATAGAQTPPSIPTDIPGDLGGDVPEIRLPTTSPASRNEEWMLRSPPPPIAGPIDPATYLLGPGDVLQLQLWGRVSRSSMLTVGP